METVYLLTGSNLANKKQNLDQARDQISRLIGPIITSSSIYKTAAWGKTEQPEFYNQIITLVTGLTPFQVLDVIHSIEDTMGRERGEKWGTRIIDIDILFWGDQIIQETNLSIPHPGIPNRKFVLIPMAELNKNLIHPEIKRTIASLLESCEDTLRVEKLDSSTSDS